MITMESIAHGYCQCGCGQKTTIVRGKPRRFVSGHNGRQDLAKRFWSHVKIRGEDECWEWQASLDHAGYGQFNIDHRPHHAHRVAYMLTHGEMPVGFQVCHDCDNPPCCNPNHLFKGTNQDNVDDKIAKGRQFKGEARRQISKASALHGSAHQNSILTESQVLEIRRLHATGNWSQGQLAKRFKTKQSNIFRIVHRETWTHI